MYNMIAYRAYRPQKNAKILIDQANQILSEAQADGWSSMTLRQLYYQFVSRGYIPNTVKDYKRLGRVVTDARYGGYISWSSIEDAGRNSYHFPTTPTAQEVLEGIERSLNINPWKNQDTYIEVWVEKQALEATIARPASRLYTPYMACKGYLSASEAWRASLRFSQALQDGKNCVLLHLGDHDPSGIDMTRDNRDRLVEFLPKDYFKNFEVKRIALNLDQVKEYAPPPNPAKEDDSRYPKYRAEFGDESWELDALRQNTIGDIISENIRDYIDQDLWDRDMAEQARRREPLAKLADLWPEIEDLVSRDDTPLSRLSRYDLAMSQGATMNTPDFLTWLANRLVQVYGESEHTDFVQSLRERTAALIKAQRS